MSSWRFGIGDLVSRAANAAAAISPAVADLLGDLSVTSTGTWMDGGAVQNVAYVDALELLLQSVAGSPTQVAILDLRKA